jgi:Tfp pilus assembly protein PilV
MIRAQSNSVARRGITLLETLIASVILLGMVLATSTALSSGQQQGEFSQEQVFGSLAAEAKLAEILADEYINLDNYDDEDEVPGLMTSFYGTLYPKTYYRLGRRIQVEDKTHSFTGLGLDIDGKEVTVEIYDADGNTVLTLVRFIPEPES